ncbi:uncharacterized protein B0I36DRAFT_432508 [Microdochium trichocladiopsis]|uniref:Transcription factor domain-containing protein n=1 Tax=Microdochium trichocladiopsis TaxID=1682393 RepID=A0A9P8Y1H6_9PEZI|nr:uncharacterized protein B0I36DRAFT_432508 [Microdochium trichocladiopsis]KAH7027169.1 hypothetical protein B0I36DRAFT_432508 [Microdochium trichocladiopsis]
MARWRYIEHALCSACSTSTLRGSTTPTCSSASRLCSQPTSTGGCPRISSRPSLPWQQSSFVQALRSRPASSRIPSFRIPPELATFEPYARHGHAWATSAAAEVLSLADCPTVESVQTLWCLGIYWFAMSDTPRVDITMAIAYASCANFQPPNSFSTPTQRSSGSSGCGRANNDAQLESMRCCFWACWSSMCTAAIPDAYARNAWQEAAGVPLPTSTDPGGPREYMDKGWQCLPIGGWRPGEEATTTYDTIDAAFLKLIGIWARVQILVRHSSTPPDVAQFEALTAKTQDVYSAASFPAARPRSGGTADSSDHARLVGLHSLYHLCRMVLLCPLVAMFSGHQHQQQHQQPSAAAAAHTVRSKAETAVEHALAQHRLVREYAAAAAGGDATRISPLTLFASFVSTSILPTAAKPEVSSHPQPPPPPSSSSSPCAAPAAGDGGVISNSLAQVLLIAEGTLYLLETLQTFWKPLEPLTARFPGPVEPRRDAHPEPVDRAVEDIANPGQQPRPGRWGNRDDLGYDTMLDLQLTSDGWDMELLSFCPTNFV